MHSHHRTPLTSFQNQKAGNALQEAERKKYKGQDRVYGPEANIKAAIDKGGMLPVAHSGRQGCDHDNQSHSHYLGWCVLACELV
jgi:hypothetical protein